MIRIRTLAIAIFGLYSRREDHKIARLEIRAEYKARSLSDVQIEWHIYKCYSSVLQWAQSLMK